VPVQRSQDGHDVLATYRQLANLGTRAPSTISTKDFERGDQGAARRSDVGTTGECTGSIQQQPNAAGNTLFVSPGRVRGTLHAALAIVNGIEHPFGKASAHAFSPRGRPSVRRRQWAHQSNHDDQRTAGLWIVADHDPTVWREDYLGALRALNRYDDPGPIIRAFAFAQRVTAACAAMTVDEAIRLWASCYAFVEAGAHAALTLPQARLTSSGETAFLLLRTMGHSSSRGRGSGFADIAQGN